jgi:hypothetical protein
VSAHSRELAKKIESFPVPCQCGHKKLMHQFGPTHERGTCTTAGCGCSMFRAEGSK